MSSFILQLLVISAFGLMAQSAPVNDVTKRSTDKSQTDLLEQSLFCITGNLSNELNVNFATRLTKDDTDDTKKIANEAFNHFSYRCKHFTKAMTLKHRLQKHLFSLKVNSSDAKTLSTILPNLQSLATIINDLELKVKHSRCVELTPAQYNIMYSALQTAPLLKSWKDDIRSWYLNEDLFTKQENRHCDK